MYKDLLFIPPALLVTNKNFLANLKVIPELVGLREDVFCLLGIYLKEWWSM